MQRFKSHILEGEMTRRLEAERRESKRAETRLRNGLHDLEEERFYCINRMMKEQRCIQRDLIRIKNGNSKKKAVSSFRRLCPDTTTAVKESPGFNSNVLPIKPAAKDGRFILVSEGIRVQDYSPAKAGRIVMPASVSRALQTQIDDFLNGFSGRQDKADEHAGAEEVQAPTPPKPNAEALISSANPSVLKHFVSKMSGKLAVSVTANGRGNQAAQETGDSKTRNDAASSHSNPKQVKPRQSASSPQPLPFQESSHDDSEFYAPDGLPRTMHTMPSFHEAFAEARKARYIRHRSKTDDEKELSISEIFRKCSGPIQSVTTKEVEAAKGNSSMGKNSN